MRLLIDSHALIWWAEASPALSTAARNVISDPANEIKVSVAALWELAIKVSSGKLTLPDDPQVMLTNLGFSVLSIDFPHLRQLTTLRRVHRDPFDRMMIAQALAEGVPIVTRDRILRPTPCRSSGRAALSWLTAYRKTSPFPGSHGEFARAACRCATGSRRRNSTA